MHIFLKFIFPFNSLLCSNICIVCEESNSVNVIKFVSFVTPSKMKFKNIYKMSKSDRGSPSTNMEAGKWKQSQGLLRPLNRIHHQIRQLRLWFSVSLKIFLKKRRSLSLLCSLWAERRSDHHMRQDLLCMFSQFPGGDLRWGICSFLCEDH